MSSSNRERLLDICHFKRLGDLCIRGLKPSPVPVRTLSQLVPAYELRIISEDESTVTLRNSTGQTVKCIKEALKLGWGMPMFLHWPVKDRATC